MKHDTHPRSLSSAPYITASFPISISMLSFDHNVALHFTPLSVLSASPMTCIVTGFFNQRPNIPQTTRPISLPLFTHPSPASSPSASTSSLYSTDRPRRSHLPFVLYPRRSCDVSRQDPTRLTRVDDAPHDRPVKLGVALHREMRIWRRSTFSLSTPTPAFSSEEWVGVESAKRTMPWFVHRGVEPRP